jgi:hypothetical protein
MKRSYLTEDVRLIQKYFPGARRTAIHTPFDLTDRPVHPGTVLTDTVQASTGSRYDWTEEVLWIH